MDRTLLDETALALFSARLQAEGYEADDIAVMWTAESAFIDERAAAYADAAIAIAKAQTAPVIGAATAA